MSPEIWSVIATGIVILVAIAASNRALRREMNERFDTLSARIDAVRLEMSGRIDGLSGRLDAVRSEMNGRIDGLSERVDGLSERLGEVRERVGRIEGLLEGFARRERAKGRGDEKDVRALPRS